MIQCMPGSLNNACYQAVILNTFDVPTAAGNRPFPKSQRQCGGLESLFGILRRVPVNLAEWVDLPDILPRAYTKVLLSEISLE